jgi:hypothetical protein
MAERAGEQVRIKGKLANPSAQRIAPAPTSNELKNMYGLRVAREMHR